MALGLVATVELLAAHQLHDASGIDSIVNATLNDHWKKVQGLTAVHKIDVNACNRLCGTPLSCAAMIGHFKVFAFFRFWP